MRRLLGHRPLSTRHGDPRLTTWAARLRLVASALGRDSTEISVGPVTSESLAADISRVVDLVDPAEVWLTIAALSGQLPDDRLLVRVHRECELDGVQAIISAIEASTTPSSIDHGVTILRDEVLVDVHHTATTDIATGIQRVARETVLRWCADHSCTLAAWTDGFGALRALSPVEQGRMTGATSPTHGPAKEATHTGSPAPTDIEVVVPWRCTYVVPELAAEPERTARLLSLARHSGCTTATIGFDTVPITSAETSSPGMSGVFANYLAAVRHFDRLTTISKAAGVEYGGWRTMLRAVGLPGPDIRPILLPAEAPTPDATSLERARQRFVVGGMPLVLCVGTHEPRKNQFAVLHAAELLWREGVEFSLSFVSGRSWNSERLMGRLAALQAAGRPVETVSNIDDPTLWAAYRLAAFTVFPSLNEGFGLPAAESLAAGTPVITSDYGSMREIAADGGALLVDPRDDASVTQAMRLLLTDSTARTALATAAMNRPTRSWDDYAAETWSYLVG